jgi:hypothetical protein
MIATFQSFATANQPINLGLNSRGPRGRRVRVAPRLDVTGLPGYSPTCRSGVAKVSEDRRLPGQGLGFRE